jgi:hypothetical protein
VLSAARAQSPQYTDGVRRNRFSALGSLIFQPRNTTAEASMTVAEQVFEQAKLLPEPLAREALDFVLFLRDRQERGEWRNLMDAQAPDPLGDFIGCPVTSREDRSQARPVAAGRYRRGSTPTGKLGSHRQSRYIARRVDNETVWTRLGRGP